MNIDKLLSNLNKIPICSKTIYIVSTPIGNINDISFRSLNILDNVNYILTEDTRISSKLLNFFSIKKKILSFNDINEKYKSKKILNEILKYELSIAIISDKGTPLINDPGYFLIREAIKLNINIIPIPGPCAAIAAISASGLPINKFCYEGFIPRTKNKRIDLFKSIKFEKKTVIFYESYNRIINSLNDMINIFGEKRNIVLAKDITKKYENFIRTDIISLLKILENKKYNKGEIVLLIGGDDSEDYKDININKIKKIIDILYEKNNKKILYTLSEIFNINKNIIYKILINNKVN
ncbi:ribosomal RNA small subunit methyltransferase I [endosymbiont of Sipalinus gigas]|uniref:16S rRNA (cytidine(1402)-2'-O)-methyltransferase n=1 Tax=endosymbiont of Sipalinus gigas TaxID=1972134 RepID=UPI000DC6D1EC|nr:16S rRNA (cytidine(1402)-2'-O)-methyltransferase [endosymbiont of Sipalinus gigas]BBA85310.1 ribosomal RNA small subunit methyltransferase I [endosymbiont of Sipalinus gigas]